MYGDLTTYNRLNISTNFVRLTLTHFLNYGFLFDKSVIKKTKRGKLFM